MPLVTTEKENMNLHEQMMNLQPPSGFDRDTTASERIGYGRGHRDARHAAAELAQKADDCIHALRVLDARLRECAAIPAASAADAYDSFYRGIVADALAAVGKA